MAHQHQVLVLAAALPSSVRECVEARAYTVCNGVQLETLVGTLEDSFSSSEQMLSNSPAVASPRALATLKAEKGRRQTLLKKLTQVCKACFAARPLSLLVRA